MYCTLPHQEILWSDHLEILWSDHLEILWSHLEILWSDHFGIFFVPKCHLSLRFHLTIMKKNKNSMNDIFTFSKSDIPNLRNYIPGFMISLDSRILNRKKTIFSKVKPNMNCCFYNQSIFGGQQLHEWHYLIGSYWFVDIYAKLNWINDEQVLKYRRTHHSSNELIRVT